MYIIAPNRHLGFVFTPGAPGSIAEIGTNTVRATGTWTEFTSGVITSHTVPADTYALLVVLPWHSVFNPIVTSVKWGNVELAEIDQVIASQPGGFDPGIAAFILYGPEPKTDDISVTFDAATRGVGWCITNLDHVNSTPVGNVQTDTFSDGSGGKTNTSLSASANSRIFQAICNGSGNNDVNADNFSFGTFTEIMDAYDQASASAMAGVGWGDVGGSADPTFTETVTIDATRAGLYSAMITFELLTD